MNMYNKLFTKILDSSIWLEPDATRIVWLTLIAAMDEEGWTQFASVANLAHRARVSLPDAELAVKALESPDPNSSDPDNEGRRIERCAGGWLVLNSEKYREMVTRSIIKEQTRLRVAEFRKKRKEGCNAPVTQANVVETPSDTASSSPKKGKGSRSLPFPSPEECETFAEEKGFPKTDGAFYFSDREAAGWRMKSGNMVKNWKMDFQNFGRNRWLHSQKSSVQTNSHRSKSNPNDPNHKPY